MSSSSKMPGDGEKTDALPQPPAGITLEQVDGSLVMGFKENKVWGIVSLVMSAWFIITVAAYSIKLEGVPITEYFGVAVIFLVLVCFGVVMVINVTTLSVSEREVVISRGPLSLSSTKRLPADQLEGLHIKVNTGQKSGKPTFVLSAVLAGVEKPRRLLRLGRNYDAARFCTRVLSTRLGVPTNKKGW